MQAKKIQKLNKALMELEEKYPHYLFRDRKVITLRQQQDGKFSVDGKSFTKDEIETIKALNPGKMIVQIIKPMDAAINYG